MFAVMSVNTKEFEYWKFVMARDEKDYSEFVEKVLEHSLWSTGKSRSMDSRCRSCLPVIMEK